MQMREDERIMKSIADAYIEQYGQALIVELGQLNRPTQPGQLEKTGQDDWPSGLVVYDDNLKKRVYKKIAADKRRPFVRLIPLIAASIAIAFFFLLNQQTFDSSHSPTDSAPSISSEDPHSPVDIAFPDAPDSSPKPAIPPAPPATEYAVIPLAAALPDGFTQTGFEQDRGKSIYYIEDAFYDNVVLTLEYAGLPPDVGSLIEIDLGGATVYGKQTDAFSLLTFTQGGILHTLTSRHDINTLLRLSNALINI